MGDNTLGQLGAGNQTNFSVPTLLGAGILTEGMVITIGAGAFDTVLVQGMWRILPPRWLLMAMWGQDALGLGGAFWVG